jgi:hypothetical protein
MDVRPYDGGIDGVAILSSYLSCQHHSGGFPAASHFATLCHCLGASFYQSQTYLRGGFFKEWFHESHIYTIFTSASLIAPMTSVWAVDYNPGNSGGGHEVIGVPRYPLGGDQNPALTTGSRDSVTSSTLTVENPTVPGATGEKIVRGDHSTISGDQRATIEQKTGGTESDAHRCRSS